MRYERESGREGRRRLATDHLKRCPLCGALNAESNDSCFVCSWYGTFDHDEESVVEALDHLLERCPELAEEFTPPPPPPSAFGRIKAWLVRYVARWARRNARASSYP